MRLLVVLAAVGVTIAGTVIEEMRSVRSGGSREHLVDQVYFFALAGAAIAALGWTDHVLIAVAGIVAMIVAVEMLNRTRHPRLPLWGAALLAGILAATGVFAHTVLPAALALAALGLWSAARRVAIL